LNGTDARPSHRGPEGSEKCGVGGREELLLKFDVAVVVEVGCCPRLDRRELATQACHSGRLWVTNTLTDILLRKLVMYNSEGVPAYPNSKHKCFGILGHIYCVVLRGRRGQARLLSEQYSRVRVLCRRCERLDVPELS
jgi:hypothetical protein